MNLQLTNKISFLFRLVIGVLFIFSAVSKLFPVEAFDFTLVSQGITSWQIAPYLSRIIISIELSIGISFLIGKNLKKLFIPAAVVLLIIFSVHLIFQVVISGNSGDCGCFGNLLPMSNLAALIKNIFLLIILLYLYKTWNEEDRIHLIRPVVIFLAFAAAIFLVFQVKAYNVPVNSFSSELREPGNPGTSKNQINDNRLNDTNTDKQKTAKSEIRDYKKTASPFSEFDKFSNGKKVNLNDGEKILAFFSLECEDCMNTAKKIAALNKKLNLPPIYILFLGQQDQVQNFFQFAGKEYPYKIIPPQTFFPFIKDFPPRVILLYKGNIIGDWNYNSFSDDKLKTALASLP